ncbi:hypothetical protein OZX58_01440 [Lactobacillus sp. ESL0680]|uniref:hypothetical protein n=1 Tax=Lactobacillus sp. ESL0680 TaxID=2983210 RepID=UPI0023F99D29|nr:hypothetical protein [Lactobacillus sp. ESL0680]WEV38961.1 hypothetical protein OZX58_01440 [Lactobacillus sp. ESL0680]
MSKFPKVPSTLPKLIAADKEKNHLTDVQEVIRINKYIVDTDEKLQFKIDNYGHKVIPSAYSDWISNGSKTSRRPIKGAQRHAIAIMLDVEYIETIFSNGLEIIPFMAQTFDFARKKLPKEFDKSISQKVTVFNHETLKAFLASKKLDKVAELCDAVYNFDKYRNEVAYVKNGNYNNNAIISVSTWLDANYSNSMGSATFLSKKQTNILNSTNLDIPNYYSFGKIPISTLNKFYINYNFIYTALNITIQHTELILLNLINYENNTVDKTSTNYKAFSFLKYDNIYKELSNTINELNSISLQDAEFIFNAVIDLLCFLLNEITKTFKSTILNYSKSQRPYLHSHYISATKIDEAKRLFKYLPKQFDQQIKDALKKLLNQ